jgi:hypothetical protein
MKYPKHAVEGLIKRIVQNATTLQKSSGKLVMNGRCPICGDSKKSKSKKRFWLHEDDDWYAITCYNCDLRTNLTALLKTYFPQEYEEMKGYLIEEFKSGNMFRHKTSVSSKVENKPSNEIHIFLSEFFALNCLKLNKPVRNNALHEKLRKFAIKKMQERNIKEKFWKNFYFCYKGKYQWRVIIPFFDNNNLMYYFQARDINPNSTEETQKYITASFDELHFPDNRIYNYYNVDKEHPVFICEGLIDSLFLDNSIALCNANITGMNAEIIRNNFSNRIWIMDNPRKDNTGYLRILSLLEMGEKCFVIPKEYEDCKDLNDIALKLNVNILDDTLILNNIYHGSIDLAKFKIELIGKWKGT